MFAPQRELVQACLRVYVIQAWCRVLKVYPAKLRCSLVSRCVSVVLKHIAQFAQLISLCLGGANFEEIVRNQRTNKVSVPKEKLGNRLEFYYKP